VPHSGLLQPLILHSVFLAANSGFVCLLFQAHKTVLDKYGKPDDVFPGLLGRREQLPSQPLSGMYNKSGNKVRLTFKMELNQVWIGTKGLQQCVCVCEVWRRSVMK